MKLSDVIVCLYCGCFELIACPGGCSWIGSGARCSTCLRAKVQAPKELTHARRVLAWWFLRAMQARPEVGGARLELVTTSLHVLPRHRTVVLEQLRLHSPKGSEAALSIETRISFNRPTGQWELVGPWKHLIGVLGAAQHALHGQGRR